MNETLKILIVDDDRNITQLITEAFRMDGFDQVEWASNGLEAINKYESHNPDIVFMDISMPIMDGYDAICKIKSLNPNAKIIVLTGNPSDPRARKILREGLSGSVIQKPVRLNLLRSILYSHAAGSSEGGSVPPPYQVPDQKPSFGSPI